MDTINSFNNITDSLKQKVYNTEEELKNEVTSLVFILESGGCSVDVESGKLHIEKDGKKLDITVNRRNDGKMTLIPEMISE